MYNEADLNILVSNVVSENQFSHCRLCLKDVQGNYIGFEDNVSLDIKTQDFQPLWEVLCTLLGTEICEKIPGIDIVCPDCVEKALECMKFVEKCNNSTKLLHQIFDNLTATLNVDIEPSSKHQKLYVIVGKDESKLILVDNQEVAKERQDKTKKLYTCPECSDAMDALDEGQNIAVFQSVAELKEHLNTVHGKKSVKKKKSGTNIKIVSEPASYVCKECGEACKGLQKLQAHEAKHTSKCVCPKCGKSYTTKECYNKHVKLCLENQIEPHPFRDEFQKNYFCEKCGKAYSTPGGLRVHHRFIHGDAQPHVCEQCGKKFTAPSYLRIHMVTHTGEKNFVCSICSNKFVSKEALLYHTRRHTGERPYSCRYCEEKFVNASSRAEHIKFKHTGPTLSCEICKRKFFTGSFLARHMARHNDPSSKLYTGRNLIQPNIPGKHNMRIKTEPVSIDGSENSCCSD